MSFCATCKYWDQLPHPTSKHGICTKIAEYDSMSNEKLQNAPAYIDAVGIFGLMTLPTFGCEMHRFKDGMISSRTFEVNPR